MTPTEVHLWLQRHPAIQALSGCLIAWVALTLVIAVILLVLGSSVAVVLWVYRLLGGAS
jgi:hypothetical protein